MSMMIVLILLLIFAWLLLTALITYSVSWDYTFEELPGVFWVSLAWPFWLARLIYFFLYDVTKGRKNAV